MKINCFFIHKVPNWFKYINLWKIISLGIDRWKYLQNLADKKVPDVSLITSNVNLSKLLTFCFSHFEGSRQGINVLQHINIPQTLGEQFLQLGACRNPVHTFCVCACACARAGAPCIHPHWSDVLGLYRAASTPQI